MSQPVKVSVWLLIFIAILPQFSETVYTPALPDIARYLNVTEAMAEYTLSIYLVGLSLGTLFWGRLSDVFGRRPCLLFGVSIFIIGCFGCFFSTSIESLMAFRFVQAFGGSTGSVLGQSIGRDSFKGAERGKVFSLTSSAISFAPAIGPVLGGLIDETFGWAFIFLFLAFCGVFVFSVSYKNLPETRIFSSHSSSGRMWDTFFAMLKDRKIIASALFIGMLLGIMFSYYSEGSFYLIQALGLSPKVYGVTFIFMALSGTIGALWSRRLNNYLTSSRIVQRGLKIFVTGTSLFISGICLLYFFSAPAPWFITLTIGSMMLLTFSCPIIVANTFSVVLQKYEHVTGTASSFFGFLYYGIVSAVTFFMGTLHNGTLFPMPLYFFLLSVFSCLIYYSHLKD